MPTCEHEGCTNEGQPCFLLDDEPGAPSYHFCGEHAHAEGFCAGCGGFFAGIGNFETSRTGLCEACEDDVDDIDIDEDDDDRYSDEEWDLT